MSTSCNSNSNRRGAPASALATDQGACAGTVQQQAIRVLTGAVVPCAKDGFAPLSTLLQALASTSTTSPAEAQLAAAAVVHISRQATLGAAAAVARGLLANSSCSSYSILSSIMSLALRSNSAVNAAHAAAARTVLAIAVSLTSTGQSQIPTDLRLVLLQALGKLQSKLLGGLQNNTTAEARTLAAHILLHLSERLLGSSRSAIACLPTMLEALAAEKTSSSIAPSPTKAFLELAVCNIISEFTLMCQVSKAAYSRPTAGLFCTMQSVSYQHDLDVQPLVQAIMLHGSQHAAAALCSYSRTKESQKQLQKHMTALLDASLKYIDDDSCISSCALSVVHGLAENSMLGVEEALKHVHQVVAVLQHCSSQPAWQGPEDRQHQQQAVVAACGILLLALLRSTDAQMQLCELPIVDALVGVLAQSDWAAPQGKGNAGVMSCSSSGSSSVAPSSACHQGSSLTASQPAGDARTSNGGVTTAASASNDSRHDSIHLAWPLLPAAQQQQHQQQTCLRTPLAAAAALLKALASRSKDAFSATSSDGLLMLLQLLQSSLPGTARATQDAAVPAAAAPGSSAVEAVPAAIASPSTATAVTHGLAATSRETPPATANAAATVAPDSPADGAAAFNVASTHPKLQPPGSINKGAVPDCREQPAPGISSLHNGKLPRSRRSSSSRPSTALSGVHTEHTVSPHLHRVPSCHLGPQAGRHRLNGHQASLAHRIQPLASNAHLSTLKLRPCLSCTGLLWCRRLGRCCTHLPLPQTLPWTSTGGAS